MTQPPKKVIANCVYCSNPPNGQEHWLNRSLGKFAGNTFLTGRICNPCNVKFGGTIDLELVRTAHTGVTRQVLGIEGRASHERKNVFDYKASQEEPPVQVFRVDAGNLKPVFEQAVGRNSDGTLIATQGRLLVIATADGEQQLRFPRGWDEQQLRAAAETRGLLGGRPVSAHVPPPETVDEFVAASAATSSAPFLALSRSTSTTLDSTARLGRSNRPCCGSTSVPRSSGRSRRSPSTTFCGHVHKLAATKRSSRTLERIFAKASVSPRTSSTSRTHWLIVFPPRTAWGRTATCLLARLLALTSSSRFTSSLSQSARHFPHSSSSWVARPEALPPDWRSVHVAAYTIGIAGHDGTLRELSFEEH